MTSWHETFDAYTAGTPMTSGAPMLYVGDQPTFEAGALPRDVVLRTTSPASNAIAYKTGFAGARLSVAAIVRIVAVGTASTEAAQPRNTAAAKAGSWLVTTARLLSVRSRADAGVACTTSALPLGEFVVVRSSWESEATGAAGRTWGKVTSLDSATVYGQGLITGQDNGTTNYNQLNVGKITTAAGGWSLEWSSIFVVDGVFADGVTDPELDLLTVPAGLSATPVGPTAVDLTWRPVLVAAGYDVERDGVVVATDVAGAAFSDTGLTASTEYDYRVRAVR